MSDRIRAWNAGLPAAFAGRLLREPTSFLDRHGGEVFQVPLAGRKGFARIDRADYWALMEQGTSPNWQLSLGKAGDCRVRVRAKTPTTKRWGMFQVARLIMNPTKDQIVTFLDGDPLNLQRRNLALAKRKDASNVG